MYIHTYDICTAFTQEHFLHATNEFHIYDLLERCMWDMCFIIIAMRMWITRDFHDYSKFAADRLSMSVLIARCGLSYFFLFLFPPNMRATCKSSLALARSSRYALMREISTVYNDCNTECNKNARKIIRPHRVLVERRARFIVTVKMTNWDPTDPIRRNKKDGKCICTTPRDRERSPLLNWSECIYLDLNHFYIHRRSVARARLIIVLILANLEILITSDKNLLKYRTK